MCGRYALLTSTPEIARILGLDGEWEIATPRYNVAPTQMMPIARVGVSGEVELIPMRWGLVPFWAKDLKIGNKMINARSETAAEKPSFRAAMRQRRCLIPVDGYYEWRKREDGQKQPYYIQTGDNAPAFMAGLWESWRDRETDNTVLSYTILTAAAGPSLAGVHHRMPVFITSDAHESWLRIPADQDEAISGLLADQIRGSQARNFQIQPVSSAVNNPRNDDERCVQAIA